jgi:NADPH2:quinone reductase
MTFGRKIHGILLHSKSGWHDRLRRHNWATHGQATYLNNALKLRRIIVKAIRVHQNGGPEVLQYEECLDPVPGEGQVLIDVKAVGVNYIDTYHRSGLYKMDLPFTPGAESAGVVSGVGDGVVGVSIGDRVAVAQSPGMYAEKAIVPQTKIIPLPQGFDMKLAAAVLLQGMTAHYLVHDTFPLKPGDRALIHAGAGGVGLLLIQMAKMQGAFVYTTVSTEEKAVLAKEAGADKVILYTRDDFEDKINEETKDEGIEVVYDSVGKDTFDKSLNCLARRGHMVTYGQSSGPVSPFVPLTLAKRSLFLTRPNLVDYIHDRPTLLARASKVLEMVDSGGLRVRIFNEYALADASEAHRALEGRRTVGKVLLVP